MRLRLTSIIFFMFCASASVGQRGLSRVIDISGTNHIGISSLSVASTNTMLVGSYNQGTAIIGRDTLIGPSPLGNWITTHIENDRPVKSSRSKGSTIKAFENCYFTGRGDTIRKFNMNDELLWKYTVKRGQLLKHANFYIRNVLVDQSQNTYLLYSMFRSDYAPRSEKPFVVIEGDTVRGEGNVVIKLDAGGKVSSYKRLDINAGELKMSEGKLLIVGFREASFVDLDLTEEIKDNSYERVFTYPINQNNNYYKLMEVGESPNTITYLQRYDANSGIVTRKELFRRTQEPYNEILHSRFMELDDETIVIAYMTFQSQLIIVLVSKSTMQITKKITIPCQRLRLGQFESDRPKIEIMGQSLIIAQTYSGHCKIGDLEFGDPSDDKKHGIFIVKQELK